MFTRAEFGTYRSGEWHVEAIPRRYVRGRRLVIWCHEHGASGLTWPAVRDAQGMSAVSDAGLAGASADLGGPTAWGNDGSVQAVDQLWSLMQTRWAVKSDKVLLMCGSMGNLTAFNYLRANPTKVAAVCSTLPAVDLDFYHSGVPDPAYPAEIETAYGGLAGYQSALPTHSPLVHLGGISPGSVPVKVFYSTDDPIAPPDKAQTFAQGIGATAVPMGAFGHGYGGLAYDRHAWTSFLERYA